MSISRTFTGVPWHTERMVRAEGDPRRDRRHCVYYDKESRYCSKYKESCHGSAHCGYYRRGSANDDLPTADEILNPTVEELNATPCSNSTSIRHNNQRDRPKNQNK